MSFENEILDQILRLKDKHHQEDMLANPDLHNPQKDFYTREETFDLCPWCAPDFINKYEFDYRLNGFRKIIL